MVRNVLTGGSDSRAGEGARRGRRTSQVTAWKSTEKLRAAAMAMLAESVVPV